MDLFGLGSLRNGLDALTKATGLLRPDSAQQSEGKGADNAAQQSALSGDRVDVPKGLLGPLSQGPVTGSRDSQAAVLPSEAIEETLASALDLVVGKLAEMFTFLGHSVEKAQEMASTLVAQIKEAASGSSEFSFSLDMAVAQRSRTAISYSGADGTASGVSEQAFLAVQSLDIYVNNETGEFSFNFESVQLEVTRIQANAHSDTAAGAASALSNVLQGLEGGALLPARGDEDDEMAADPLGQGVMDLLAKAAAQAAEANKEAKEAHEADLAEAAATEDSDTEAAPGAQEAPLLTLREIEENVGSEAVTRYRVDLFISVGQLFTGRNGPEFEGRDGSRHLLKDPAPQVGVEA